MATAFGASLAIAGIALVIFGAANGGTRIALQLTARWSYCFFLPAYAGAPLATLFGPSFQPMAKRGRDLGLAFASAHLTHVGLIAWLYYISPGPPVSTRSAIFFGTALILTYVLALFSIPMLTTKLPPRALWLLRTLAMEYIAVAFLYDFAYARFSDNFVHLISYIPFVALGSAAALVRIAAYVKRFRRNRLMPEFTR